MDREVREFLRGRRIRRICHFTPSRNLAHILTNPAGLLASRHLEKNERAVFNPTDLLRLDGYPDHVCCSIEYPNAWYFEKARRKDVLFLDWVVVFIDPRYLWQEGTRFCPRNAAAGGGRAVVPGLPGIKRLYEPRVAGAYDTSYTRGPLHPVALPTDEQAEILIPDRVQRDDILGLAVRDPDQGRREIARLKLLKVAVPPISAVPMFYTPRALSAVIRVGKEPEAREVCVGDHDAAG